MAINVAQILSKHRLTQWGRKVRHQSAFQSLAVLVLHISLLSCVG